MVSKASEDLPDPDSPVITISRSRGSSRSMFLRLCVRAPRMRMVSIAMGELASGLRWGLAAGMREPTRERNEVPIWGQTGSFSSLALVGLGFRDYCGSRITSGDRGHEAGRAQVRTPVTNAQPGCHLPLEKRKRTQLNTRYK